MKRKTGVMIVAALLGLPFAASAATVQVYPTITNSHGGTKFAADMTACITHDGTTDCAQSVPTFTVPDGSAYEVTIQPAAGYSYGLDSACSGVAQGDIICNVSYTDGAPIVTPPAAPTPTPQAAPAPVSQPVASSPSAAPESITISIPETIGTSTSQEFQQQVIILQQLVALLERIITLLTAQQSV